MTVVGDRHVLDGGTGLHGQLLPRHEIGVMLHLGREDQVIGTDIGAPPRVGDQVDRLGRVAGEDDFVGSIGADEASDLAARPLVRVGRLLGQRMDPAVDVGVVALVIVHQRLDHAARLLRRRRVVQIHKRFAMHDPRQNREIPPDSLHVEWGHEPPLRAGEGVGGGVDHATHQP